jgi:hypothetical protein
MEVSDKRNNVQGYEKSLVVLIKSMCNLVQPFPNRSKIQVSELSEEWIRRRRQMMFLLVLLLQRHDWDTGQ